jgi:hypothetical protein
LIVEVIAGKCDNFQTIGAAMVTTMVTTTPPTTTSYGKLTASQEIRSIFYLYLAYRAFISL